MRCPNRIVRVTDLVRGLIHYPRSKGVVVQVQSEGVYMVDKLEERYVSCQICKCQQLTWHRQQIWNSTRASPWGRASSCVRPSLVTRIQVTKEFPSGLVMSKLKGNAESTGRTTRSTSYFHQYFKTTIYIHQESFKQID